MMFMMTMPPTTSDSADDADQHREDAVGRRVVDVEDRVRREDAEVVGLLRLQPPRDAQRDRRFVHRLRDLRDVARLDRQIDSGGREPNIIWNWPSGMTANSSCDWPSSEPRLRADADDAEVDAFDLDDLVERIDVGAEQPIGGLPAEHGDRPRRVDLGRAHQPAAFGVEAREVDVFAGDALDLRVWSIDLSR